MTLFRCSTPKKRTSFNFLNLPEIHAVGEVLDSTVWFDHFHRAGGITSLLAVTRFGPMGYPKYPLYASEKKDTTYYEFAYWKLKCWQSELNVPTRAATIKFDFVPTLSPKDVKQEPNVKDILNKTTYLHAHNWISALPGIPESVSYPSVRDPNPGGINFAIFSASAAVNPMLLEDLIMTVVSKDEVEVIIDNKSSIKVLPIK